MKLAISEAFVDDSTAFRKSNDKPGFLSVFGRRFGLSNIAYMHLPSLVNPQSETGLVTTYSKAWEDRYVEKGYDERDPVVKNSFKGVLPFDWSAITNGDRSAINFFGEAAEFGVSKQGVSIPIRGPEGDQALFSVSSNESAGEWRSIKQHLLPDLTYLGFLVHSAIVKKPTGNAVTTKLSPREKDVLLWASYGKSCWETGKILGLSERTVNFYIGNASAKLGAATKTQAVAIALRKCLILQTI